MQIPATMLYFFAAILFAFVFFYLLLKKHLKVVQMLMFSTVYLSTVLLVRVWMFDLFTFSHRRQEYYSAVPFHQWSLALAGSDFKMELQRLLFFILCSSGAAFIYGVALPFFVRKKGYAQVLLKTALVLIPLEILGLILIINGMTNPKVYDTSVFLFQFFSFTAGYLFYRVLSKHIGTGEETNECL